MSILKRIIFRIFYIIKSNAMGMCPRCGSSNTFPRKRLSVLDMMCDAPVPMTCDNCYKDWMW